MFFAQNHYAGNFLSVLFQVNQNDRWGPGGDTQQGRGFAEAALGSPGLVRGDRPQSLPLQSSWCPTDATGVRRRWARTGATGGRPEGRVRPGPRETSPRRPRLPPGQRRGPPFTLFSGFRASQPRWAEREDRTPGRQGRGSGARGVPAVSHSPLPPR